MKKINLDRDWEFRRGFLESVGYLSEPCIMVNLPHDGMISTKTIPDAPAKYDSGYYQGDMNSYTHYEMIPSEWEGEKIGLCFDGVMMHSTIEINGSKVGEHHYGYSPFYVDITDCVVFGEKNRISVNTNTGVQPSSRWYTGSGLFRSISLCHAPRVHVKNDGIYIYTKEVTDDIAFLEAEVEICNETLENHMVEVTIAITKDNGREVLEGESIATVKRVIQINSGKEETARMAINLKNPDLWDVDTPSLYKATVTITDIGKYTTRFIETDNKTCDTESTLFGIRTISVDSIRGLRINGRTVKLKGGCLHHDNGLLGAVSLYEVEARKVQKLKEIGFNAIRTAHNPPSTALVEACDRLGMYIFDEAYDAWGMAKRPGDFNMYFSYVWEDEVCAFVKRDRSHPSVIMWSTGNEIPERGGLSNGYTIATKLSQAIRKLDSTRPISNGICSLWNGLDDLLAKEQDSSQNAANNDALFSWDKIIEPFTNGLDIVGYNYMEDVYEKSHEAFPERVILGSENFPKEIGFRWPVVESLPYVIGDFTWTAWDYLGEAGIGKSVFVEEGDPLIEKGSWAIMPPSSSPYPWRLANDADVDITGMIRPQGEYRNIVWGSSDTHVYAQHPKNFGKVEVISMWGFTDVEKCWNYEEYMDAPIEIVVFSNADEVELIINGEVKNRKTVSKERPLPDSVRFQTVYTPGVVEAVSYKNGVEISRDKLETTKKPSTLVITPEKSTLKADGHDVVFVNISIVDEDGKTVPDAEIKLHAKVEGEAFLAGFGTGCPITEEVYSDEDTITYRGRATAILRGGYTSGKCKLTIGVSDECLSKNTYEATFVIE